MAIQTTMNRQSRLAALRDDRPPERRSLPVISLAEGVGVLLEVFFPTFAKGILKRRSPIVAMAEAMALHVRAVRRMQKLREGHGRGPVLLRAPGRVQALVLDDVDVRLVLSATPEPFSNASSGRKAALSHFEPGNSLISTGTERVARRAFHEAALETGRATHSVADSFRQTAAQETSRLLARARAAGELDWAIFTRGWFGMVRRVLLGDGAAGDVAQGRGVRSGEYRGPISVLGTWYGSRYCSSAVSATAMFR